MALTPIFALGWENGLLEANAAVESNLPTVSNTKDINAGGYSLRSSSNATPMGRTVNNLLEMQAACYFNHNGVGGGSARAVIFHFVCADGRDFRVTYNGDGNLTLRDNTTVLATTTAVSSGLSVTDTWYAVSAALKIATSGGYFDFYNASGEAILSFSGNTGSSPVVAILFSGYDTSGSASGWTAFAYFADCRALDATGEGSGPTSTRQLLWSQVDGNGQSSQWTNSDDDSVDNYTYVDDGVAPDGDTTYVKALSSGLVDQYTHAGITVPVDWRPVRVWPTAIAKKTDAGVATTILLGLWKDSEDEDSAELSLGSSYGLAQTYFEALPDGSELDETNINAAEIRLVSAGAYS